MPDPGPNGDRGLDQTEVALLAHELRGALTVIMGFTELLKRPLAQEEQLAALEAIQRAVGRADALIDRAIDGTLAESKSPGGEPIDAVVLAHTVAADQHAVTGRDIAVSSTASPRVFGDRNALERALGNLVDNALKYSPDDAPVEVTISHVGEEAIIDVADRGQGIPEQDRARVFEPFERLDVDSAHGSGLGLTVVASIVRAHGGDIEVQAREGGGSVMRMKLPVA